MGIKKINKKIIKLLTSPYPDSVGLAYLYELRQQLKEGS